MSRPIEGRARRGPTGRGLAAAAAAVLLTVAATAAGRAAAAAPTAGCGGAARGDSAPDPGHVLDRARTAYDSLDTLRARFRQTIEMRVFEPPRRREGRGAWYQEKPGLFRMDFAEPDGDLVVSDGRHVWLFYPSTHPGQVVKSPLEEGAGRRGSEVVDLQGRVLEKARTEYDVSYGGCEELDGHRSHRLVLEPRTRDTPYVRIRVWIDARRWLVRRLEFEDRSETVRTVTLDELETGVSLPDSLFRFRPPEDVEVFEG